MADVTSEDLVKGWRKEILSFVTMMGTFQKIGDPGVILPRLSAMSARARYLDIETARSQNRTVREFRFEELHRFLDECEYQFKIWSRFGTITKQDWDMSKG